MMGDESEYLKVLESFKKRKGMYITTEDLASAEIFLSGFMSAFISRKKGQQYPHDLLHDIGAKRGWKKSACGPIYSIRESDLSKNEKMNELIDIHIECVKAILNENETNNANKENLVEAEGASG